MYLTCEERIGQARCIDAVKGYKQVKKDGALLTISFNTVDDYFYAIREISQQVKILNERSLFYFAAAVSDFYIPQEDLAEHKIQSGDGKLSLNLHQVNNYYPVL